MPFRWDTDNVEFLIACAGLRKFCPKTVVQPTSALSQGVIGHQLPVLGQTKIPIRLPTGRAVPIRFLVMQRDATFLGLKVMKPLSLSITLEINVAYAPMRLAGQSFCL